jgi:hypothetical protein
MRTGGGEARVGRKVARSYACHFPRSGVAAAVGRGALLLPGAGAWHIVAVRLTALSNPCT